MKPSKGSTWENKEESGKRYSGKKSTKKHCARLSLQCIKCLKQRSNDQMCILKEHRLILEKGLEGLKNGEISSEAVVQ